jgi:hypothetical protein
MTRFKTMKKSKLFKYGVALILTTLGLLTLFLSSAVLFDWFGIREKQGNYVLLVIWANFVSGFLYLFAVYGLVRLKKWTIMPLIVALIVLALAGIGLFVHINAGGLYETKTLGALFFRTTISLIFIRLAYLITRK